MYHALALIGLRDVRDYKTRIRPNSETLGSASPFNDCQDGGRKGG